MKTFKKFKDFLEGKKVQEIDAADGLAGKDYDGPLALKPEQEPTKGKKDKTNPYKASSQALSGLPPMTAARRDLRKTHRLG